MKTKSFTLILSFLFIILFSPFLLAGCNTYPDKTIYEISTAEQWNECVRLGFPTEMDMGKTWIGTPYVPTITKYVLKNDISCSNFNNENPTIESYKANLENYSLSQEEVITNVYKTSDFVLDGQNHKVSGFSVYSKYYASVFGMAKNATVKNIVFEDVKIEGSTYVGGLFGYVENANIELDNVKITSSQDDLISEIGASESSNAVGGLIGYAKNSAIKIRNCRVQNTKIGDRGTKNVGGLIGYMYTSETNALPAYSEVWFSELKGDESVGGAIGCFEQSYLKPFVVNFINLKNCGSSVTANSGYAGGIIGRITYSDGSDIRFIGCENTLSAGKVEVVSGSHSGGILGFADWTGSALRVPEGDRFTFENCKNFAKVTASKKYAAGVVGYLGSYLWEADFIGCENNGQIKSNTFTAGIAGYLSKMILGSKKFYTFSSCRNTGNIMGGMYVAGILGAADEVTPVFKNCKNESQENYISGYEFIGGISGFCGDFENCTNSMMIKINGSITVQTNLRYDGNYVGGIAAYCKLGSNFKNCSNTAEIKVYNKKADIDVRYVGGICGESTDALYENCSNSGKITADRYVGGIVGHSYGIQFKNCSNTGVIFANDYVGGIGGWVSNPNITIVKIEDCSATGTVYVLGQLERGTEDDYTSDLVKGHGGVMFGRIDSVLVTSGCTIKNVTVTGEIYIVNNANYIGGFAGYATDLNNVILRQLIDVNSNVNVKYNLYRCKNLSEFSTVNMFYGVNVFGEVDEEISLGIFNNPYTTDKSDYVNED